MSVLITGGAGFLGTQLIDDFLRNGRKVTAFDFVEPRDATRGRFRKALDNGSLNYVRGDISDRDFLFALLGKTGGGPVIHLAGILTTGCDKDPDLAMKVNVNGFRDVLEGARLSGNRRVVLASTISVYGRGLPQPMNESMATEPDGWYGLSKLMCEQMGLLYSRRFGLDFRAVRLAAVTGPGRSAASGSASLYTSFIPEKAALGEPYTIEVAEDTVYPVVYIKDAAAALYSLASAGSAPRRIYNISSGRVVASDLVAAVKEIIPDARFTFRPDPLVMAVVGGFGNWEIDCRRAEEDLGFRAKFTVGEMVRDIIAFARRGDAG